MDVRKTRRIRLSSLFFCVSEIHFPVKHSFAAFDKWSALGLASVLLLQETFTVSQSDLDKALHNTVPSNQRGSDILVDYRPVHWDDIGGLDNVKQQLQQVMSSVKCQQKYKSP